MIADYYGERAIDRDKDFTTSSHTFSKKLKIHSLSHIQDWILQWVNPYFLIATFQAQHLIFASQNWVFSRNASRNMREEWESVREMAREVWEREMQRQWVSKREREKERESVEESCDKWHFTDSEEFCSKDLNFNILNISKVVDFEEDSKWFLTKLQTKRL